MTTEEEIKRRINLAKDLVILSVSRINYVLQIIELKRQNNRILLRFEGFYAMANRDFVNAALIAIRRLHEKRLDTQNLHTLIASVRESGVYDAHKSQLDDVLEELEVLANLSIGKDVTIITSSSIVHANVKPPKKEVVVTFTNMRDHLIEVGKVLNKLSGILWKESTVLELYGSSEDDFIKEMNHIELSEDIGVWTLRESPESALVVRRKEFLKQMKGR